jgi:multiple sugar transport system ATP-binding protein
MNLLPVTAIGAGQVQLGSRKLAVEGPLAEMLASRAREELTGGLRPEHFQLAPATNRNLRAEVSHGEALGNEQLLTCRLEEGGHLVQVRVGPETVLPPGASLNLDIDPRGWRLFDASGEALPLPPEPTSLEPTLPYFT